MRVIFPIHFDHFSGLPLIQKKIFNLVGLDNKKLFFLLPENFQTSNFKLFYQLYGYLRLVLVLFFNRNAIVVSPAGSISLICILSKIISRCKIVHIIHVANFTEFSGIKRQLFLWVMSCVDQIVTISHEMEKDLRISLGDDLPIVTIYNPVFTKLPESLPNLRKRKKSPVKIVSLGRFVHQKDYPILLEALKLLKDKLVFECEIYGEGHLEDELIQFNKSLGLDNHVKFCGVTNQPLEVLKNADCFVLHSRYEGLPTALIEALAYCPRLVSFDIRTGPSEILDGPEMSNFLIKDRTAESLASGILLSLANPVVPLEERNLSRFAACTVKSSYDKILADLV